MCLSRMVAFYLKSNLIWHVTWFLSVVLWYVMQPHLWSHSSEITKLYKTQGFLPPSPLHCSHPPGLTELMQRFHSKIGWGRRRTQVKLEVLRKGSGLHSGRLRVGDMTVKKVETLVGVQASPPSPPLSCIPFSCYTSRSGSRNFVLFWNLPVPSRTSTLPEYSFMAGSSSPEWQKSCNYTYTSIHTEKDKTHSQFIVRVRFVQSLKNLLIF